MTDKVEAYFCNVHKPHYMTYEEALDSGEITKEEYNHEKREARKSRPARRPYIKSFTTVCQGVIVKLTPLKMLRASVEERVVDTLASAGVLDCSKDEISYVGEVINGDDREDAMQCDVYVADKPVYFIEIFRIFDKESK